MKPLFGPLCVQIYKKCIEEAALKFRTLRRVIAAVAGNLDIGRTGSLEEMVA